MRLFSRKKELYINLYPFKTWTSLLLLGVTIGFTTQGNHAQYTLAPQAIFLIFGVVFLQLHLFTCWQRASMQRDAFNPSRPTPYWNLLLMDVGLVCLMGAATWSGLCFFNAQLDTEPAMEQTVEIVSKHPNRSPRYGRDTVHVAHAAFNARVITLPLSPAVFGRLEIGQCLSVQMHAGYFRWVWIEPDALGSSVSCRN
jgi:hypothetical protein